MNKNILNFVPDEWKELDYLDDNDRLVIADLLYSFSICKNASIEKRSVARSMDSLRQSVGIKRDYLYSSVRKLEAIGFFKRNIGKSRVEGEKAIASEFFLNIELIYNPPLTIKSGKDLVLSKLSETLMGTAITSTTTSTISSATAKASAKASAKAKASATAKASASTSRSISDSSTNVMVNKKESSNNKKAMLQSNTIIELKERNGTDTLKEERNGSSMIEVKENKGMQSKHARTFSIEELRKYCTIKENELSKRYYTEQDVDRLEEELETYINRFQDVEGADKLLNDVFKETGELRGKLYFGGGLISENFEKEYNVTKVF